jgi:hypothetical protein
MNNPDYLPRKDRLFADWVTIFLTNLQPSLARFNFPQEQYQLLSDKQEAFAAALNAADDPSLRTKGVVCEKNEMRAALTQALRQAVRQYLTYNPAVTVSDRVKLGLPVHKTTRTPAPEATSAPACDVDTSVAGRVTFHFFDSEGSHKRAKPHGQHGAEIAWVILDSPTIKWSDLLHSSFDTHTPKTLSFEGHDRGKTLYYALRWENTRGKKGPWSNIRNVIIP